MQTPGKKTKEVKSFPLFWPANTLAKDQQRPWRQYVISIRFPGNDGLPVQLTHWAEVGRIDNFIIDLYRRKYGYYLESINVYEPLESRFINITPDTANQ